MPRILHLAREADGNFQTKKPRGCAAFLLIVIPGWSKGPDPESRDSGLARFTPAPE
jgi:hypothetical protein